MKKRIFTAFICMILAVLMVLPGKQVKAEEEDHNYKLIRWDFDLDAEQEEDCVAWAVFQCTDCTAKIYIRADVRKMHEERPTCTEDGLKTYILYVCFEGKDYMDSYKMLLPATGHAIIETEARAATCTKAGNSEYYTCSECGKYFSDEEGKNEIEAKGHKLTKTEARAATCTEVGNSEYYTCSECGKYFSDEEGKNEIEENSRVIEAKGHKLEKTEVKAATCTEAGNSEYYTCSECGKYFSDAEGKNEIAENSWAIEEKDHKLGKTEAKAATCTEAGNNEYYTCNKCGKFFSDPAGKNEIAKDSWIIKETGHLLIKTNAKAATCTTAGNSEYYTCSGCGKYFSDAEYQIAKDSWYIPATGHEDGTLIETNPPTGSHEGIRIKRCGACGQVQGAWILPKKTLSLYLGKSANIISDVSQCSISLPNAKKYQKYFKLDTQTGKITTTTKNLSKVKIAKTIPVKVTTAGKTYTVDVKLKIAAPKISIKKQSTGDSYRYSFRYNIKGATKIKVRTKNVKANTKVLDRYLKKPKSNSDSYVEFPKEKVKKIKFTINAYYGKNVSETRTITK